MTSILEDSFGSQVAFPHGTSQDAPSSVRKNNVRRQRSSVSMGDPSVPMLNLAEDGDGSRALGESGDSTLLRVLHGRQLLPVRLKSVSMEVPFDRVQDAQLSPDRNLLGTSERFVWCAPSFADIHTLCHAMLFLSSEFELYVYLYHSRPRRQEHRPIAMLEWRTFARQSCVTKRSSVHVGRCCFKWGNWGRQ